MAKKKQEQTLEENVEETLDQEQEPEIIEEKKEPTPQEIIAGLEEEIKVLKNELLKQRADVENTKKRLEKERITERKYAAFGFAKHLLTPMDNFQLALSHIEEKEETKALKEGMEMIKKQLDKVLEDEGVSEVGHVDEDYDPNYHQAIMTEKIEGIEPNKITDVLQKGYMFKDRLIRPAMVKISE
jgi:molecular chaperone GrpE